MLDCMAAAKCPGEINHRGALGSYARRGGSLINKTKVLTEHPSVQAFSTFLFFFFTMLPLHFYALLYDRASSVLFCTFVHVCTLSHARRLLHFLCIFARTSLLFAPGWPRHRLASFAGSLDDRYLPSPHWFHG